MVKVTTFAPWFLAAAVLVVIDLIRTFASTDSSPGRIRRLGLLALIAGMPVVFLTAWTSYADRQKQRNILGGTASSAPMLKNWNFGTLAQRKSPETWKVILERTSTAVGDSRSCFLRSRPDPSEETNGTVRCLRRPLFERSSALH